MLFFKLLYFIQIVTSELEKKADPEAYKIVPGILLTYELVWISLFTNER